MKAFGFVVAIIIVLSYAVFLSTLDENPHPQLNVLLSLAVRPNGHRNCLAVVCFSVLEGSSSMVLAGGGHERAVRPAADVVSVAVSWRKRARSSFVLFLPALMWARQAVNISPAPWRRGAVLLPLSCPPDLGSPPKKIVCAGTSFPAPPENAELDLGSRGQPPLGCPT
jgi:hypothetical protein